MSVSVGQVITLITAITALVTAVGVLVSHLHLLGKVNASAPAASPSNTPTNPPA